MTNGKVLGRVHKKVPRSHSSLLVPMIDKVLKSAGTNLRGIDGFCVSIGPGSFTGLRIGAATIKALAMVTRKRIAAVPTLDAIALGAKRYSGIICTVLDARKNKVYAALYRSDGLTVKKLKGPMLLPLEALVSELKNRGEVTLVGDFALKTSGMLPGSKAAKGNWQPKPEAVGLIGGELFKKKKFVSPENLEPLYIYSRECDIKGI